MKDTFFAEFSSEINRNELKKYRDEVGRRTIEIVKKLNFSDIKRKIQDAAV